jgi:hypothetical protein
MALIPQSDGVGAAGETAAESDLPAVVDSRRDIIEPIIVPNTLWRSTDPAAYDGGRPAEITHLRELEQSDLLRRDDARWGGALEVIPTKADYVLDLIRINSPGRPLRPRCAFEMMVVGDEPQRHRPLGHVPVSPAHARRTCSSLPAR